MEDKTIKGRLPRLTTTLEGSGSQAMQVEPHGHSPWHPTSRPSGATSRPNIGAFIHGHPAGSGTASGVNHLTRSPDVHVAEGQP